MIFMDWWKEVNEQLAQWGEAEVQYGIARRLFVTDASPLGAAFRVRADRQDARFEQSLKCVRNPESAA